VKRSLFPALNAIGCLILTGLVVAQWNHHRALDFSLSQTKSQLSNATTLAKAETVRATTLERDITVLKESIKATQEAAERSNRLLDEKELQITSLQAELTSTREQVTIWQTALAERDSKLKDLSAELSATRARLDAAIAKLKAAAAP
jgi:chromosome segregation ATPase